MVKTQDHAPPEVVHYAPGRPAAVRHHVLDGGLQRRSGPRGRLHRVLGAGVRGPAGPQRVPRPLPALPGGDLRPGRRRVAQGGPLPLPALRQRGDGEHECDNRPAAAPSSGAPQQALAPGGSALPDQGEGGPAPRRGSPAASADACRRWPTAPHSGRVAPRVAGVADRAWPAAQRRHADRAAENSAGRHHPGSEAVRVRPPAQQRSGRGATRQ